MEGLKDLEDFKLRVMGVNVFPMAKMGLKFQSEQKRKETTVSMSAPDPANPILDLYDCKKESPYTIEEILPDKVWRVGYKMELMQYTRSDQKKMAHYVGMDPTSKGYRERVMAGAKTYGEQAVAMAKQDLEIAESWWKTENWTKETIFDIPPFMLNMIVVKLNGGGLLLYAPVKMHKEAPELLLSWLESLGPVQWIVVASAAHTLLIHDAVKTFPDAKLVGPEAAEAKLVYAKACQKFDFVTTKGEDLQNLKSTLVEEGAEIDDITGDMGTNAVVILAHKEVLLECDLMYGHHDGHGLFDMDGDTLTEWKREAEVDGRSMDMFGLRLFKFAEITKPNSPFGFLPKYRFWMMDPNGMGLLGYSKPAADGSSRREMASSLRRVLALPFNKAAGVHFNKMDADKFRKNIDAAWNWLDGKPLL